MVYEGEGMRSRRVRDREEDREVRMLEKGERETG